MTSVPPWACTVTILGEVHMHDVSETAATVLDQLRCALTDAVAMPLSCLSREDLAAWVCELQGLRAQMDALTCASAAATRKS